jgi:hypothetical protein
MAMGICDVVGDWDEIGCTSDGFEAMKEYGGDLLESWGFNDVEWSDDPIVDPDSGSDLLGAYDPSTGTIHLSPDFLCQAEGSEVANIVAHEAFHAAVDQAGLPDAGEETAGYNFGQEVQTEIESECTSSESGTPSDLPDFPWGVSTPEPAPG